MRRLIVRRLVQAIPVLIGITLVTFSMVHLVPGDPARALAGQRATPQILASIRRQMGLDQPLLQQYWHFISGLPRGQLGYSFLLHQTTDALVRARLPTTLFLVFYGVVIAVVLGVPLAVVSATHSERWLDHGIKGALVVGLGLPSFWIGLLLIAFRGRDRNIPIPFGPYLAVAGWIALLWGPQIVGGYLRATGMAVH